MTGWKILFVLSLAIFPLRPAFSEDGMLLCEGEYYFTGKEGVRKPETRRVSYQKKEGGMWIEGIKCKKGVYAYICGEEDARGKTEYTMDRTDLTMFITTPTLVKGVHRFFYANCRKDDRPKYLM